MDSVSQLVLGAAVGVAVMGRRTAVWKAALWGGVCGTLPDLDVLIDHGDAVANMTQHRSETHALFWLTLLSPAIATAAARIHGEGSLWRRWWLAVWLALVTHPLLDAITVYGTRLGLPFTDFPYAVGSVFIIDPLYTVPLIVGVVVALLGASTAQGSQRGLRWNAIGLVASTAYLAWGMAVQLYVDNRARADLMAAGVATERVLVTPAPLQSLLWRVVAVEGGPQGDTFHEGFYSLFDGARPIRFDRYSRGTALADQLRDAPQAKAWVDQLAAFSKGYYKLSQRDGHIVVTDLRMGQEPAYVFSFAVARTGGAALALDAPRNVGGRSDVGPALRWLLRRMWGEDIPPPR